MNAVFCSPRDSGAGPEPPPRESLGFLLVPGFSMLDLAAASEVLGAANSALGAERYVWNTLSQDGGPVTSNTGITFAVNQSPANVATLDYLFVCAAAGQHPESDAELHMWLRNLERRGCKLGALGTGTVVLARANVLKDRRCTVHWQARPQLHERFPEALVSNDVFVADRGLLTCSGGTSVPDLFLYIVRERVGRDVAESVAMQLQVDRMRTPGDEQQSAPVPALTTRPRKLQFAIREMEAALDNPVSPRSIAAKAGVTTRHLQRLFQSHTGASPARFYMDLRLKRARLLLEQTHMPILEVAVAVGFSSHSHFSKRYRERFGVTPVQSRATC
ncbi:MAG: GlxA family transcriptional regulator [Pseudomonadota bacterium]